MVENTAGEEWKGKNLLDKIQTISIFVGYAFLFIIIFGVRDLNPIAIFYLIIGLIVYIMGYIAFHQYTIRKVNERHAGVPVMGGWMDQDRGVGEKYKWEIESMTPFSEMSDMEKGYIQAWIDKNLAMLKEFEPEGIDVLSILTHEKEGK